MRAIAFAVAAAAWTAGARDGRWGEGDAAGDCLRASRISPEAVQRRKASIVDALREVRPGAPANGKQSLRVAMIRLSLDPADRDALRAIRRAAPYTGHDAHFSKLALAQIRARHGEALPADLQALIRDQAGEYADYLSGGTENHIGMKRVAAMLFGEAFPDLRMAGDLSGRDMARVAVEWMSSYGREVFRSGMSEYLSPVYFGVHHDIWIAARDHAQTDAARLMSRAMLDWMWADLAVNAHAGQVLAPVTRDKVAIRHGPPMAWPVSSVQWLAWLYWGDERSRPGVDPLPPRMADIGPKTDANTALLDLGRGVQTAIGAALSPVVPPEILRNLGAKRVDLPYSLRQSRPDFAVLQRASTNAWMKTRRGGTAPEPESRYHLRSVTVAPDYAIGTGYFRADLHSETPGHLSHTAIALRSDKPVSRIVLTHPYWSTAEVDEASGRRLGADNWVGRSPFEQTLHHETTILWLCDIPERDPYAGESVGSRNPEWPSLRVESCIRAACLYAPAALDERRETPWGWLLREGDVYIAIRPFGAESVGWERCAAEALDGYERLEIRGGRVGAFIDVGDRAEFGSIDAFAASVAAAAVDLSRLASHREVAGASVRGAALKLGMPPDGGFPPAWIDGAPVDYETWPVCESPYVSARDGVLDVNDGTRGFAIDWTRDFPRYTWYELSSGGKIVTKTERIEHGTLVVGRP